MSFPPKVEGKKQKLKSRKIPKKWKNFLFKKRENCFSYFVHPVMHTNLQNLSDTKVIQKLGFKKEGLYNKRLLMKTFIISIYMINTNYTAYVE